MLSYEDNDDDYDGDLMLMMITTSTMKKSRSLLETHIQVNPSECHRHRAELQERSFALKFLTSQHQVLGQDLGLAHNCLYWCIVGAMSMLMGPSCFNTNHASTTSSTVRKRWRSCALRKLDWPPSFLWAKIGSFVFSPDYFTTRKMVSNSASQPSYRPFRVFENWDL